MPKNDGQKQFDLTSQHDSRLLQVRSFSNVIININFRLLGQRARAGHTLLYYFGIASMTLGYIYKSMHIVINSNPPLTLDRLETKMKKREKIRKLFLVKHFQPLSKMKAR